MQRPRLPIDASVRIFDYGGVVGSRWSYARAAVTSYRCSVAPPPAATAAALAESLRYCDALICKCFQAMCCLLFAIVCATIVAAHSLSLDAVGSNSAAPSVRLVDQAGAVSSVGLLQFRSDSINNTVVFGSVCGMNLEAADVVCRQLGFAFGSVSSSPCGTYGGANLCSAAGAPVAMKDLACTGGELSVQECLWSEPDVNCLSHSADSVVYCGNDGSRTYMEGTLRMLSYDGAPAVNGQGRLEIFSGGYWAPVCRSGFSAGAEIVACKSMGFDGVSFSAARFSWRARDI